jgi:citrate synthase
MATLKEKLTQSIPALRDEIKTFVKSNAGKSISEVTVAQAYGGMRGVKALVCDTSVVPPDKGLIIRGRPIAELKDKLPEAVFYLLITGEMPDDAALEDLKKDLRSRAQVPDYVWKVMEAMPKDSHPMAMFSLGVLAMEKESAFRKKYTEGIKKTEYWQYTLEDCLSLIGKLPTLAAGIYRMKFNKGSRIEPDTKLDWAGDYARMLGVPDTTGEFANLMRLYMVLHSDHEGGNVSAHTCHCVGSALSDPYYAVSAGLNGLAGPLHGLANQECLRWVIMVKEKFGGVPNVDAASGCLLYHFGLTEFEYYTVLFGVSRAMGMCSQLIVSRALGEAIERPKSVTTEWMKQSVAKG